jgi:secreted PhoX family phosphatase
MPSKISAPPSRRLFLQGAAASALAVPLAGLSGRRAQALARLEPIVSPYGPLAPVMDQTTGLPLLQLPQGFTYQSFGWSGDIMADGRPNPTNHDGMAVVRSRLVGQQAEITLIRNHEATVNPLYGTIEAPGFYDRGIALIGEDDDDNEITGPAAGGTTTLLFVDGKFTEAAPSLGGTWNNCAGGLTPWGTWLTGEEDKSDFTDVGGQPHGYMFEVSPENWRDLGRADQGHGPLRPRGHGL